MKIKPPWHLTNSFTILSFILLCLFLQTACTPPAASKQQPHKFYLYKNTNIEFYLGDDSKYEFTNLGISTDGKGKVLIKYEKKSRPDSNSLGDFLKLSENGGATFGEEYKVDEILQTVNQFDSVSFYIIPTGFAAIANREENIFYSQSTENLEDWSEFRQINDEQNSYGGALRILQPSKEEIYCLWTDKRRNFKLTYFSSSFDGGKTWSPNQPIDLDFREGDQQFPQIVLGANGRLHTVWQDQRDRKTLFDIHYSYSDDKGKNWIPSRKINDDDEEVWQMVPTVVADGENIYVAFADFREIGEENDRDWNIYFAHSNDNGTTWEKNKRINDVKEGRDGTPILNIDDKGNLYLTWETTRNTLFGQFAFSYSNDKGNSWSPSVILTKPDEMLWSPWRSFQPISADKYLTTWFKKENGKSKRTYSILEKTTDFLDPEKLIAKAVEEKKTPLKYQLGRTLFSDDFSKDTADKWEVESGVWDVVDGTFRGVYPNSSKPFISFAKFGEPEKYVMSGRFRFDPVAHHSASIYFRKDEKNPKHYVITNRFRYGSWLSIKEDDLPIGTHESGGTPLVEKRFPFRKDRWYKFTLVVTPEQVDYYVEGRLMLSFAGKLIYPKGKIGIGGFIIAPTYFDDISISELTE